MLLRIVTRALSGENGNGEFRHIRESPLPIRAGCKSYLGAKVIMKITKLAALVATIAIALFILIPNLSWADDGAGLYKAKCAACHGADGAGKPAAKIPSLISDEAKKMSDADLEKAVAEKPKHAGVAKALTPDQIKMVVGYVRSIQK
jgi:cytochrome c6